MWLLSAIFSLQLNTFLILEARTYKLPSKLFGSKQPFVGDFALLLMRWYVPFFQTQPFRCNSKKNLFCFPNINPRWQLLHRNWFLQNVDLSKMCPFLSMVKFHMLRAVTWLTKKGFLTKTLLVQCQRWISGCPYIHRQCQLHHKLIDFSSIRRSIKTVAIHIF